MSRAEYFLNRGKMLSFLDNLPADTIEWTFYVPPGLSTANVISYVEGPLGQSVEQELTEPIVCSKTGAVFFWGPERKYLVLPPFPITQKEALRGCVTTPLQAILTRELRIGFVLVRLGAYAIGLCQGETLTVSKVGTGLVHGRHRQGGSSAARFRRHREKQIEYFLTRVCEHVQEKLGPEARTLDHLVYGGAWTTVLLLQKRCPFLARFDDRLLPPLLDIPDPRQPILETAIGRVWSSKVVEWQAES